MAADLRTEQSRRWKEPWRKWYQTPMWRNLRVLVLARDPICKACERKPSNVADHIRPHRGVWALFADIANLQGLCKPCHDAKTAREDGGFGNKKDDPDGPVSTGAPGKQFVSGTMSPAHLDAALNINLDELLDVTLDDDTTD